MPSATISALHPPLLKGTGKGALPPMLLQYAEMRDRVQAEHAEALLLFQVGDFYETFGEDAERFARLLNLALTHKSSKDFSTPMAGVPVRTLESTVEKLLAQGVCVVIADQVEPAGTGLVAREIVQTLTPGTISDARWLGTDENYLAAVASGDGHALALLDISTGDFRAAHFHSRAALHDELARWRCREVLLAPEISDNAALLSDFQSRFPVMLSPANFAEEATRSALSEALGHLPEAIQRNSGLVRACGAVLLYAERVSGGKLPMVRRLVHFSAGAHLSLPEVSLRALEIFQAQSPQGLSLMDTLACTRTAPGRRRLRAWLRAPLLEAAGILARQDSVALLTQNADLRAELRSDLFKSHDLERLSARAAGERISPREMSALARTLELVPEICTRLQGLGGLLGSVRLRLEALPRVVDGVRGALVDEPAARIGEGDIIRDGHSPELDEIRRQIASARQRLSDLEQQERAATGVSNLKIGHNNVLGYYFECNLSGAKSLPERFVQVATLKDRARFRLPELQSTEKEIELLSQAESALQQRIFVQLRAELAAHAEDLSEAAGALADLDVLCALAEVAAANAWVRPTLSEDSVLRLEQARHPVVEHALRTAGHSGAFVPNDALLNDAQRILLLTGPNMAGKSTYLRTVALAALLHQIGSFVPASAATLPIYKAIFTRIGASDDLAGGRSTFMVEMSELAAILHGAGEQSLVILDEIGRGTSTLDGLAIAQAALENLHESGAHALFATHYFELTALESALPRLRNLHVAAEEENGALTFFHQVVAGAARRSYGVEVARLAGLPTGVIARAGVLLAAQQRSPDHDTACMRELAELDLANTTPLEALALLHRWKNG